MTDHPPMQDKQITRRVHFAVKDCIFRGVTLAPLSRASFVAKCSSILVARSLAKVINPCDACRKEARTGKEYINHNGCR